MESQNTLSHGRASDANRLTRVLGQRPNFWAKTSQKFRALTFNFV